MEMDLPCYSTYSDGTGSTSKHWVRHEARRSVIISEREHHGTHSFELTISRDHNLEYVSQWTPSNEYEFTEALTRLFEFVNSSKI